MVISGWRIFPRERRGRTSLLCVSEAASNPIFSSNPLSGHPPQPTATCPLLSGGKLFVFFSYTQLPPTPFLLLYRCTVLGRAFKKQEGAIWRFLFNLHPPPSKRSRRKNAGLHHHDHASKEGALEERERAELIMPNLELFVPLHTLSLLMHGLVITRMKHHHHPPLFLCTRAWDSPAALGTVDGRRCPLIPIKSLAKAGPAALLYRRHAGWMLSGPKKRIH